jgi:hypothetical protein
MGVGSKQITGIGTVSAEGGLEVGVYEDIV